MIPLLKGGEPIQASYWNTLFGELDAKVTALLDGKSPLLLGGVILDAGVDLPLGKCFWFNRGGNRPRSEELWPLLGGRANYDHTAFAEAAADPALETAVFDAGKKILALKQPVPDSYRVRVSAAGNFFDGSLEAHRRGITPNDAFFTEAYNTWLMDEQGAAFAAWVAATSDRIGRDIEADLVDYDLAGSWLRGGADWNERHMPDTFKKPNHLSFSDQSIYHGTPDLWDGTWSGGQWTGLSAFRVSASMQQLHSREAITAYFESEEPGVSVSFEPPGDPKPPPSFWLLEPGVYRPERISSYGLAELILEGLTHLDFKAEWNKYQFYRVHNLSASELTVEFWRAGKDGFIHSTVVTVPPLACRCVRKDAADGYIQGFNYFPKFQEGDPTWLQWPLDRSTPEGCRGANSVISPALVYQFIWALNMAARVSDDLPRFGIDPHQAYDVGTLYRPYFAT